MAIKVLVVEDEADLAFLIRRRFGKRIRTGDFEFLFASNGVEALKQLETHPDVHVVMSDIKMPEMDGLTLLSELNERYPLLRAIIVSAYGDMKNIRTAMNRGAYDFLIKPVDFRDLELTLDKTARNVQQILHEVEERKKAEEQLVKLKKAVENMRLGVTITDLEGVILYSNPAETQMHGYRGDELIGQDVGVLAPPELRHPMAPEQIQQWNGSVRESVNIRKDGSTFPVWLISDIVKDPEGKPVAIVTSCEDITERKRAEEELKQHRDHLEDLVNQRTADLSDANAKLAELNASKDKFFSIISHDLRNPFSVMLGYTQLIEANFDSYAPEKIQQMFGKIRIAAERLYVLLENLLTWSQIQRGAMEYSPRLIDIGRIAEENRELLLSQAGQKYIELRNSITHTTRAYADYHMISAVLRNLLSNALKFTPKGGVIDISAHQNADWVEVAVSDTGVGISEADIPKLFRIDVRHSKIGTAGEKGSGLGLNLCKDLVEKNGGVILVESVLGQGTTVRFAIPRTERRVAE